jgi:hypothetical protein
MIEHNESEERFARHVARSAEHEAGDLGDFIDAWQQDTIAAARLLVPGTRSTGPDGPEPVGEREAPDPEWVRGKCPSCGALLVSNSYYVGGRGYILVWECWERLGAHPTCEYRRVI